MEKMFVRVAFQVKLLNCSYSENIGNILFLVFRKGVILIVTKNISMQYFSQN